MVRERRAMHLISVSDASESGVDTRMAEIRTDKLLRVSTSY